MKCEKKICDLDKPKGFAFPGSVKTVDAPTAASNSKLELNFENIKLE